MIEYKIKNFRGDDKQLEKYLTKKTLKGYKLLFVLLVEPIKYYDETNFIDQPLYKIIWSIEDEVVND